MQSFKIRAGVFLGAIALLGGCATERTVGTGKSFKGPLGLQLYSLRGSFAKDVPGTMAQVRQYGFKYVELAGTYKLTPEQFNALLASNKLVAVSGHFPFDRFRGEPEAVAKEANALGLKYAGCAWIPHEGEFSEADARRAADVFNKAGAVLAKHGIRFFYHTHGYEFRPHGNGTLFDLLMRETKPELVTYEIDVYWVQHPGYSPAKLIDRYPNRFELMHVKDMKKGLKGDFTGRSDVNNDVAVGTGQMDWPAILAAGKRAGVKWYFIEDESDHVHKQIPVSLKYLEGVQF